jgi:hypothetical protein
VLILAACTQSKRGRVPPVRQMRTYSATSERIDEVLGSWQSAAAAATETTPLRRLYKGAYWSAAVALADAAGGKLLVASAGLGLIDSDSAAATYSATFAPGHADSVPGADSAEGRRRWWELLGGAKALRAAMAGSDKTVVVLPDRYLEVVAEDLLASEPQGLLVFAAGASAALEAHLGTRLISLDARMVRALGTNVGALAPSAARFAFQQGEAPLRAPEVGEAIRGLITENAPPLYPVRQRQTPQQVDQWIRRALRAADPPGSATAALRRFRDSGLAFEQKHFHRRFRAIVGEMGRPNAS